MFRYIYMVMAVLLLIAITTASAQTYEPGSPLQVYFCTEPNWAGDCVNLGVAIKPCYKTPFPQSLSVGPTDNVVVVFYNNELCAERVGSWIYFPGDSELDSRRAGAPYFQVETSEGKPN